MSFLGTHFQFLIALFCVGLSVLITRAYSQAAYVYGVLCVVLFAIFGEGIFIALAIAAIVLGTVLKNSGL